MGANCKQGPVGVSFDWTRIRTIGFALNCPDWEPTGAARPRLEPDDGAGGNAGPVLRSYEEMTLQSYIVLVRADHAQAPFDQPPDRFRA